jgi:hypothetical protein
MHKLNMHRSNPKKCDRTPPTGVRDYFMNKPKGPKLGIAIIPILADEDVPSILEESNYLEEDEGKEEISQHSIRKLL